MQIATFNNIPLNIVEHPFHEFLLSNKEVALGYGTNIQNLAHTKNNNSDEFIEGKHWLRLEVQTNGGRQKVIHWTKRGIVRLGFFIKSENAKKFRDWAEDYIVKQDDFGLPDLDFEIRVQPLREENARLHEIINKHILGSKKDTQQEKIKAYILESSIEKMFEAVEALQKQMEGNIAGLKEKLNSYTKAIQSEPQDFGTFYSAGGLMVQKSALKKAGILTDKTHQISA